MQTPLLSLTAASPETVPADALVVGVQAAFEDGKPRLLPDGNGSVPAGLADLDLEAIGVTGAKDQLVRIPSSNAAAKSIALIGTGRTVDIPSLRAASGSAVRQLGSLPVIALALPTPDAASTEAVLEGAALGAYTFTRHRGTGTRKPAEPPRQLTVIAPSTIDASVTERPSIIAEASGLVRDLVNTAAGDMGPDDVATAAAEAVAGLPITLEVLDEHTLAAKGYGGIVGVGRGSARPPRLVIARYAPQGASKHLALVGKGITFDSGGLSLKPAGGMVDMKTDMTGAATALAATIAAARLGVSLQISAWLCLADNMPSGTATRPGDVLVMKNGMTVEVTNTDAEGRLVLGDGLAAASLEHPDAIVDIATLTGAQVVALGDRTTAVMGTDAFVHEVLETAGDVAEPVWPMPLPDELDDRLRSTIADMVNATVGQRAAGMLLAGKFLERFVGKQEDGSDIPWAHLDIAGPSENNGAPYGWLGKGATAVMTRTLVTLAERMESEE